MTISSEESVSLQGTLDTFALPDVLRLVASTRKTGRLRVSGTRGEGSIWVEDGDIVAGSVSSTDPGADYATQVFDLLRFPDGSFMFESDRTAPEPGAPSEIEPVLREAEALLGEWRNIEQIIPSGDSWMNLAEELPTADVVVDRRRWQVIVAVGAGSTVLDIGHTLGLGEIQVARELKEMVELGLLDVGAPTGSSLNPPAVVDFTSEAESSFEEAVETSDHEPEAASVEAVAPPEVAFAEPTEPVSFSDQPSFLDDSPAAAVAEPAASDATPVEGAFGDSSFGATDSDTSFGDSSFGSERAFGTDDSFSSGTSFGDSAFGSDPFGDSPADSAFGGPDSLTSEPSFGDPPPPPPPPPAPLADVAPAVDADASDPAEVARQLANLSPRAARAVAAAARADTDEEREAALADMDETDEPLNRGLLMKFLSNE